MVPFTTCESHLDKYHIEGTGGFGWRRISLHSSGSQHRAMSLSLQAPTSAVLPVCEPSETDWWMSGLVQAILFIFSFSEWPDKPFDSSWVVWRQLNSRAECARARLRGSLISQRDPQNNDEIGDPGSPISWGPQNFMTPALALRACEQTWGLHAYTASLLILRSRMKRWVAQSAVLGQIVIVGWLVYAWHCETVLASESGEVTGML